MNASSKVSLCRARRNGAWLRVCARALCVALVITLSWTHQAAAQSSAARLLVLDHTQGAVPSALQERVDATLHQQVQMRSGQVVESSPVPFDEVAIAAGCADAASEDCTRKVASTLEATWLLIRHLRGDPTGTIELTLTLHAPDASDPRKARQQVAEEGERAPEQVVPALVATLYGNDSPQTATEAQVPSPEVVASTDVLTTKTEEPPKRAPTALRVFSWSATIVGCSLIAAGATLGGISKSDHNDYADLQIDEPQEVDRAHELLDRAQQRARRANGLIAAGAVGAALGVAGFIFAYVRTPSQGEQKLSLDVWPQRGGAAFAIAGTFGRAP